MQSDIMTIKELSEYLKLKEKTAYKLVADGKIPGFKVGGAWRFQKSEINAWIKQSSKQDESKGKQ
jgi:excisionase family DNA binding protein